MDDDNQENQAADAADNIENGEAENTRRILTKTKPTFADVVKAANHTEFTIERTSTPPNIASGNDAAMKTQYLLAEVESAPKHLMRYAGQENLNKLMSVYSEKCGIKGFQNSPTTNLIDEPSCSKMIKNESSKTDLQKETIEKPKMQTEVKAVKPQLNSDFVGVDENDENQKQILNLMNANKEQKPFTTVIAGTTVVIPTALAASKPAESPTPPMETSEIDAIAASSVPSIGSLVCRICHNSENPERLVSPCLCKGSLSYVHIHCLERWISTSRSTVCELCQFQYKTEQTLRYTCFQSLRMWYSRSMSRRALQEDCQMFSLLTLVAFGIIGTLLVGIQYYFIQGRHWGLSSMWTKGWLLFFLFTTLIVYFINIYMIIRSQLAPWYRWWQSARDIKLILENRKPFKILHDWRTLKTTRQRAVTEHQQQQQQPAMQPPQPAAMAMQNPNMPQTTITPATPRLSSTVCSLVAPRSLAALTFTSRDKQAKSAVPAAPSLIPPLPPTPPTPLMPMPMSLQPYSNKLHISIEVTSTAAEIIEIPLDNNESSSFEFAKSYTAGGGVASTAMSTPTMMQ